MRHQDRRPRYFRGKLRDHDDTSHNSNGDDIRGHSGKRGKGGGDFQSPRNSRFLAIQHSSGWAAVLNRGSCFRGGEIMGSCWHEKYWSHTPEGGVGKPISAALLCGDGVDTYSIVNEGGRGIVSKKHCLARRICGVGGSRDQRNGRLWVQGGRGYCRGRLASKRAGEADSGEGEAKTARTQPPYEAGALAGAKRQLQASNHH